jgi:hypothetical protein
MLYVGCVHPIWQLGPEGLEIGTVFCGLVVRVLGYRYRGPGSVPGATRFSEK